MAHLPLNALEWKMSTGAGRIDTRVLNDVKVNWSKFNAESISTGGVSAATTTTTDKASVSSAKPYIQLIRQQPHLHVYFVNCDDGEVYKMVVKKQIKAWLDVVTARKNQEWLIVHVTQDSNSTLSQAKAANANNFLIKTSVLDKIKADFNVGKKDRCTQLMLGDMQASDLWKDFLEKVIDGIQSTYGAISLQLQEDIRKMEVERKTPGFNYLNFFILKESLATIWSFLHLAEEALIQYDELDAIYEDCIDTAMSTSK
jgi:hypothetical protein